MYDIKGPLSIVNDTFKLKHKKGDKKAPGKKNDDKLSRIVRIKIYLIVFTCCHTRATILDYAEKKSYALLKDSFVMFINICGRSSLIISDADSSFKAVPRVYRLKDIQWLHRFNQSKEFHELKNEFNNEFKFNIPNGPQLQNLVERMNKIIVHPLLKLTEINLT